MVDRREPAVGDEGRGLARFRASPVPAAVPGDGPTTRVAASRGEQHRSRLTILGLGLLGASLVMLFSNVQVSGGLFGSLGLRQFGWSLLPLLFGVGWIVLRPRGLAGWMLAAVGLVILVIEIIGSLTFYYRPVSLLQTLIMLLPGAIGLALVARSL